MLFKIAEKQLQHFKFWQFQRKYNSILLKNEFITIVFYNYFEIFLLFGNTYKVLQ